VFVGADGDLDSVAEVELGERARDVALDGGFAEVELERLFVGVAMDQLRPAVLAGGVHIGPTGGVALVIPSMPT
jgi:hypothetical protein